jgi:1-deoxy-D-xylulose-5-phosphate synthase
MSIAAKLKGEDRQVVAVIGDGSMTGGLAFEGLNNASINPNNLLIILNDNNMAIDPIKGGLSHYLTSIHYSKTYNAIRHKLYRGLKKVGLISEANKNRILRLGNSLKSLRANANQNNIFEGLNIRYFGPIDGHDVLELTNVLSQLKNYSGPKVLHIITKKGKGYKPAEEEVTTWHAPGVFNIKTGERIKKRAEGEPPLFQEVFGNTLLELAEKNERIVGITPAMPSGCSMNIMMNAMPERTFDVGIAEGHAVTFSAGLAKDGMMPFCNIYSSFMQRAYDNVIHDVALQNLNVVFCLDRAGIVGNDGATHQGQFDLTMFRCIPNMTIGVPRNEHELRNLMYTAQLEDKGPFMIRYPRGKGIIADWKNEMKEIEIGKGEELKKGKDIAIVGVGPILYTAQKAIEKLEKDNNDIQIGLYDLRFLKPMDEELLHIIGKNYSLIYTIEDGTIIGGAGSAIEEWMMDNGYHPRVVRLGLPDKFIEHGSQAELFGMLELDAEGIYNRMKNEA